MISDRTTGYLFLAVGIVFAGVFVFTGSPDQSRGGLLALAALFGILGVKKMWFSRQGA